MKNDQLPNLRKKLMMLHGASLLAVAALTLALWFMVIGPSLDRNREFAATTRRLSIQEAEFKRLLKFKQQLSTQVTAAQTKVQNGLKLQPAKQLNAKIAQITDLANRCGLQINSVNPAAVQSGKTLLVHPLLVTGVGNYQTVASFMQALKSNLPDTSMQNFSMSAVTQTRQSTATFSMTLLWCAQKDDAVSKSE